MIMGSMTKSEEETDSKYGKLPEERSIAELMDSGVVIANKPQGPSSHEVTSWVKKMLDASRAGHAGTLDPNVSGVLPIGLNRATRVMGLMLKGSKEYVGIVKFHCDVEKDAVEGIFQKFTGEVEQIPPVKSAVKRALRKRKVYYLEPIEFNGREVLFRVGCEAGTYIRKLCFDMGEELGCGANMLELRRTKAGKLEEGRASKLQDVKDAYWLWEQKGDEKELRRVILNVEDALDLKRIWLRDSAVEAVCSGAVLAAPGVARLDEGIIAGDTVALMSLKDELVSVAVAEASSDEIMKMERGVVAKTMRVMMKKGTYPKCW
ncbi:MAG: H/ACA ribonucleoprotein complex subunit CBF5 [Candidatus Fermentimicrarchaeum limneticum]|uniref:Probable tRNA pseudouridine synthase B n=1 Tax=Fermentimicrarchaeum limneticum TaxID=2795018 RepID=A0A7D6BFW3_FERL1|nr:MAG: H/ACA ribonucleoprotein complex subunit CBF5 [Candidatus Fermentimicrarchaeum limneticum]